MKPTIALTFDYEMFSAQPGTVQKNMIEPTEKLLALAQGKAITYTFFDVR